MSSKLGSGLQSMPERDRNLVIGKELRGVVAWI